MTMNEQIEEMAKICCFLCEFEQNGKCLNNNPNCKIGDCYMARSTAQKLYNAGYRKQSEVVRCKDCDAESFGIMDGIKKRMEQDTCVKCGEVIPEGRQVCPNCEGDKK